MYYLHTGPEATGSHWWVETPNYAFTKTFGLHKLIYVCYFLFFFLKAITSWPTWVCISIEQWGNSHTCAFFLFTAHNLLLWQSRTFHKTLCFWYSNGQSLPFPPLLCLFFFYYHSQHRQGTTCFWPQLPDLLWLFLQSVLCGISCSPRKPCVFKCIKAVNVNTKSHHPLRTEGSQSLGSSSENWKMSSHWCVQFNSNSNKSFKKNYPWVRGFHLVYPLPFVVILRSLCLLGKHPTIEWHTLPALPHLKLSISSTFTLC